MSSNCEEEKRIKFEACFVFTVGVEFSSCCPDVHRITVTFLYCYVYLPTGAHHKIYLRHSIVLRNLFIYLASRCVCVCVCVQGNKADAQQSVPHPTSSRVHAVPI